MKESAKRRRQKSGKKKENPESTQHKQPLQLKQSSRTHNKNVKNSGSSKHQKPSSFLEKMRARLSGGHFRMINEKLYTCTGSEALGYFKDDPSLFDMYHTGYQEQMSRWPQQPVNIIVNWLKERSPSLVVADFGCGDARLAKSVKNKVFSFDLVASDPTVIACDMSNTPLNVSLVDVAVFCLSLMGTNYWKYLQEAHRVLKPSGWLLIAEVKSRFDPDTGGADPDKFLKAVSDLGFNSMLKDFSNKMFILLHFQKKRSRAQRRKGSNGLNLSPACISVAELKDERCRMVLFHCNV